MKQFLTREVIPLRQKIEGKIWRLILDYCRNEDTPVIWREPIVRFADANAPEFAGLQKIVTPDHHIPQDFLPDAKTVLSWFLPFQPEVGRNNLPGEYSSAQWAEAYLITNEMAAWVNEQLVLYIQE